MSRRPTSIDDDKLVPVAFANDQVEAGMLQGLLEGAGIRSAQQQIGIDGPSLGYGLLNPGGGSRRILVRAGDLDEARVVLAEAAAEDGQFDWPQDAGPAIPEEPGRRGPRNYNLITAYARAWVWSFAALALAFGVFMVLRLL
jgi:hypothetical protein